MNVIEHCCLVIYCFYELVMWVYENAPSFCVLTGFFFFLSLNERLDLVDVQDRISR